MLFIIYLKDIEDNMPLRSRLSNEHMTNMGAHLDSILMAGPMLNKAAEKPVGGLLVVEAESEKDARRIIEMDPLYQAGLWEEVRIHPYRDIINNWRG